MPSAKPATICFPSLDQQAQLTFSLNTGPPFAPLTSCLCLRSAKSNCPFASTKPNWCELSLDGFARICRTATPFVGIWNSDSLFPLNSPFVSYTASPPPSSAEMTRQLSSLEKTTCETLGTGIVACGAKGFTLSFESTAKACRTLSVVAMINESGPAAASSPLPGATERSEAVVGGNLSLDHGVGSKRSLFSDANAWNPSCSVSMDSRSVAALADMMVSTNF